MKINIRKWEENDLEIIKNLSYKLCKNDFDNFDSWLDCNWVFCEKGAKYFHNLISSENSCLFVAILGEEIIGYVFWELLFSEPWESHNKVELSEIFVIWEYRSFGIWNKLIEEFFNWSKKKWVKNVRVLVSYENIRALNFYKRGGFRELDIILEKLL